MSVYRTTLSKLKIMISPLHKANYRSLLALPRRFVPTSVLAPHAMNSIRFLTRACVPHAIAQVSRRRRLLAPVGWTGIGFNERHAWI